MQLFELGKWCFLYFVLFVCLLQFLVIRLNAHHLAQGNGTTVVVPMCVWHFTFGNKLTTWYTH